MYNQFIDFNSRNWTIYFFGVLQAQKKWKLQTIHTKNSILKVFYDTILFGLGKSQPTKRNRKPNKNMQVWFEICDSCINYYCLVLVKRQLCFGEFIKLEYKHVQLLLNSSSGSAQFFKHPYIQPIFGPLVTT